MKNKPASNSMFDRLLARSEPNEICLEVFAMTGNDKLVRQLGKKRRW